MVSGKEPVAEESVTHYPEVILSPQVFFFFKWSVISTLLERQLCVGPVVGTIGNAMDDQLCPH